MHELVGRVPVLSRVDPRQKRGKEREKQGGREAERQGETGRFQVRREEARWREAWDT